MESSLKHPADHVKVKIGPVIKVNKDMTKEIVWTYLVARKYKNDYENLAEKLGVKEETMPNEPKIWISDSKYFRLFSFFFKTLN